MPKKKFNNLDTSYQKTFKDFIKCGIERGKKRKDYSNVIQQCSHKQTSFLKTNRHETTITWIGHSTFLIQMNGVNILTDPVYANQMAFKKRLTQPGLSLSDLPSIDIICISHGHYDHLDFNTIRSFSKDTLFILPIGLKQKFTIRGFKNVHEMNWWESKDFSGVNISFVPAQHWTKRTPFDRNKSHWGGFVFKSSKDCLYHVGDSAYFSGFKEIGKKFQIDTALIPIGAYEPEWFMKYNHMSPEEAVQAFLDLNAKLFIPMHYGTFKLADDTPFEALERLCSEWQRKKLNTKKLKIALLGETIHHSMIVTKKEEAFY
ncbi:MBL fold metallo-hydrolase [Gottfriedia luciferensis]|uniref:MBL fold metallo-hydrolase n=1 Tax=Gottfriedia luciferensis TaxID=178774 RepID=UPI000B444E44|nr:MBL fold metallo-hydrolase [Gottfriedia luciferensis]